MPTISMFFGIVIKMYYEEHNPPHFHAEYQGFKAVYLIETGEKTDGKNFPTRANKIIQEWSAEHKIALLENWKLMEQSKNLFKIPGADQ
jgi:hypothetical protein